MTNKFKFGDKVWHEKYGLCVITRSEPLRLYSIAHNHPALPQIPWRISESELAPASDWVKCSEWMPEFGQSVTVYDGDRMWTDTTYDFGDGLCFYYDDDGRATHWMPLPAPPVEVER